METQVIRLADGVELPLLVSARMPAGFRHGFTMRAGGVSQPPFEALNLGFKWGDDPARVHENHRRLLAASGAERMLRASQVHGVGVLRVGRADSSEAVAKSEADGLCSDERGVGLSVHVADCTPILLACERTGACAALHAGWRGTVAGMARAGVAALAANYRCHPGDLVAALGPCIGVCCFEVGPEVEAEFAARMPQAWSRQVLVREAGRKTRIDLRAWQRLEFLAAGLADENIDVSSDCTRCDPARRFFSFRAAGRATGQSVGFVVRA
jgi:YfiH family protein